MRLLVSVKSVRDARAALRGGADVVDAKDPANGALGPVATRVLRAIHAEVAGRRPLTAALGDASGERSAARAARRSAACGAALVKIGFARVASAARGTALAAAAIEGAVEGSRGRAGVVLVAYADADPASSLSPATILDIAARAGARGVLLDTMRKAGPGLRALVAPAPLAAWVAHAHEAGLLVALAGRLTADDLAIIRETGADIAGVRGAACVGGRSGRVAAESVRQLRCRCAEAAAAAAAVPRLPPCSRNGETACHESRDHEINHGPRFSAPRVRPL
jgi:uncharacterized protein (UPF0264 family)